MSAFWAFIALASVAGAGACWMFVEIKRLVPGGYHQAYVFPISMATIAVACVYFSLKYGAEVMF